MATIIDQPVSIQAAGNKTKVIEEYIGRVSSKTNDISVARMISPMGWEEPAQTPEFSEYTIVLKGVLKVNLINTCYEIKAGQAIIVNANEWVKYSTPYKEGAEYIAVCLPAFSPDTVHRD